MNVSAFSRISAAALLLAAGTAASAALTAIDSSAFSASDPLVDYGSGSLYDPINGQSVGGVAHGFTVSGSASTDATIDIIPGVLDFIDPENIEGNAGGVLSLDFGGPQTRMGFGWAQDSASGGAIELFDAADASLGTLAFSGAAGSDPFLASLGIVGGFAGVQSDTAFVRAEVSWNGGGRFAFDNLRFGSAAVNGVPEPGTLALLGLGLVGLVAPLRRKRQRRQNRNRRNSTAVKSQSPAFGQSVRCNWRGQRAHRKQELVESKACE